MTSTHTETPRREAARLLNGLRRTGLGMSIVLLVQYGIGMGVNIYVKVPSVDKGSGIGRAFGKSISNGPAALSIHAALGLLLIAGAIFIVVRAVQAGHGALIVTSVVALVALLGAAISGASFVDKGQNGASLTMAILTGVTLICYIVPLYILRAGQEPS